MNDNMTNKNQEYKLYKTKSKLSNLLQINNNQNQNQQQISFYILVELTQEISTSNDGYDSIWFNRSNGELSYNKITDLEQYDEIGKVYGYIGKFQINQNFSPRLLFIKKCEQVGLLRVKTDEHLIYRIKEILILSLSPPGTVQDEQDSLSNVEIDLIKLNENSSNDLNESIRSSVMNQKNPMNTSVNNNDNISMNKQQQQQNLNSLKFEKKILDEIVKIFQDNNGSFYFSYTYDLTNTIERQQDQIEIEKNTTGLNYNWLKTDEKFFWNRILLNDLIDLEMTDKNLNLINTELLLIINEADSNQIKSKFILPIIQGFVQIESFDKKSPNVEFDLNNVTILDSSTTSSKINACLKLSLISRRSRYRLGTRFKRRGIDENGNVANFVETEQIINAYDGHTLSFVQIRGSIPIYWSQPGIKYRPAPRIDKGVNENKTVFRKHFDQLEELYKNQSKFLLINLVEEYGKESLLGDAYVEQVAELDRDSLLYVQFDFHEHCKGLKFENVSILKERVKDMLSDQAYCWVDKKGFIFKQKTLLRVNCIDCLDRTNVVQMVLAKYVLENQLNPLGILVPPAELPIEFKKKFSILWANNGDAISEQYAGTSALKGDFTRTGERNLTGIMKDGVKSANRFYLRFKDNFRQLAYEVLQGVNVNEEDQNGTVKNSTSLLNQQVVKQEEEIGQAEREREENIRQLIADCRRQLVDLTEDCYGSWALINYNEQADLNQVDPDVFLLFTSSAIYISNYDDSNETFVDYQKIELKNVEKLELGPEPVTSQQTFFRTTNNQSRFHILRIYYKLDDLTGSDLTHTNQSEINGYFHTFRSCNLRFFNNLVITTNCVDDLTEALRGICHTIQSTAAYFGYDILFEECNKMIKKKSKPHQNMVRLSRLSSTLIDEETIKNVINNQSNSKLEKFKKIFGSKLFNKTANTSNNPNTTTLTNNNNNNNKQLSIQDGDILEKPPSIGPSEATKFFLSPSKDENLIDLSSSPSSVRDVTPNILNENLLIDFSDLNIDENDSIKDVKTNLQRDKSNSSLISLIKNNSMQQLSNNVKVNMINSTGNNNKSYIPLLSQKQYLNRKQKLNDVESLVIKNTKAKFIFI